MSTALKIDLVVIVIALLAIVAFANSHPEPVVPDEVVEQVNAAIDNPSFPTSFIDLFADSIDAEELLPGFGLTIDAGDPCSLDLEEVTCADAAAVVKYRKALKAIKVEELKKKVDRLEREALEDKYGFHTC